MAEFKGKWHKLRIAFLMHRAGAKRRKVEFLFSFDQWLTIWVSSGKLKLRGKGKGKFCMARLEDKGPYAVGNVEIILHSENVSQSCKGKPRKKKLV
jgi:hypothetical protein